MADALDFLSKLGREGGSGLKLDNVGKVMVSESEAFIDRVKGNLNKSGNSASGALMASIRPEFSVFGFTYTIDIMAEDYWKYVDKDTKARTGPGGRPSLREALQKWITQKKEIQPWFNAFAQTLQNKKKKLSTSKLRIRANRSLAYLISRKMRLSGRKGTGFLSREIPAFERGLNRRLSEAFKQDVVVAIREIKKENNI